MISLAEGVLNYCKNPHEDGEFDCLLLCMLMKSNRWSIR